MIEECVEHFDKLSSLVIEDTGKSKHKQIGRTVADMIIAYVTATVFITMDTLNKKGGGK